MRNKKKLFNVVAIAIPVAAIVMATTAFLVVNKNIKNEDRTPSTPIQNTTISNDDAENTDICDYTSETNYKGKLAQYPDLYQYPFRKSDSYISNKEFSIDHEDTIKECEADAKQFMETLFNVNYRDIAADMPKYVGKVMTTADYRAYHTEDLFGENEKTILLYDYINNIADYFVQNQMQVDATFYTDSSLVYSDFYIFVRGELVFTIYDSADTSSEYEIGTEYAIPMEVAMHRTPINPNDHSVVAFGRVGDNTFFLNP